MSILDVTARYQVNSRVSVLATLPIVFNQFSQLLPPLGAKLGKRYTWNPTGVGDLSLYGQSYLLNPREHPFGNIALGCGIKIPTGSWNLHSTIADETGANPIRRSVYPPAVLPGDGGVGILVGYDAYKMLRKPALLSNVMLFSSAIYLINPRTTNGTPSIIQELGVPLTPNFNSSLTNSVADTFAMQAGASVKLPGTWNKPKLKGLRLRVTWNWEGLRKRDLFGGNSGFRQPGYVMSIGPGFSYGYGKNYVVVDVPVTFAQYINAGKTVLPGVPVRTPQGLRPGNFNPFRQLGMVAPVSLSVRYVRAL